jgi:hypothetical protein
MASLRPHQPGAFVYEKYLGGQGKTFTQDVIAALNWIAGALDIPTVVQNPADRKPREYEAACVLTIHAPATWSKKPLHSVQEHVLSATAHALYYLYRVQRKERSQRIEQATREIWSEMI